MNDMVRFQSRDLTSCPDMARESVDMMRWAAVCKVSKNTCKYNCRQRVPGCVGMGLGPLMAARLFKEARRPRRRRSVHSVTQAAHVWPEFACSVE